MMNSSPDENHIGYVIAQIARLIDQALNERLKSEGVSVSQARVIYLLYRSDAMTQSELQRDLLIKPSSLTKLIDVLEEKGLVTRKSVDKDARIKRIYLTEVGKQKEKRLCEIKMRFEEYLKRSAARDGSDAFLEDLVSLRNLLS